MGERPINRLRRDATNYTLRNKPRLRERVGMVLPRERKRTRQEWVDLLQSVIDGLPDGIPPTVSNIAARSGGLLTVPMIRNAVMWHDIRAFKEGWMKREHEVPRSRAGWTMLLRQAVAELAAGIPGRSRSIAPDPRLDVEDAICRARQRLPHDTAKLVDEAVVKLRMESDLLYDMDALAESLNRSPEQVQLTLQALHEVFGEGSWDYSPEPRAKDKEQAEASANSSYRLSQGGRAASQSELPLELKWPAPVGRESL